LLVLGKQDEDLRALRDQGVDVGKLPLIIQVGVGIDERATSSLDGLLHLRLVGGAPPRLLEVVPRNADDAAARTPTPRRAAAGAGARGHDHGGSEYCRYPPNLHGYLLLDGALFLAVPRCDRARL